MNTDNRIDKLVEDTLNSATGAGRATPKPWLLNRINARLATTPAITFWDIASAWISRPAIAVPSLALLVLVNVAAIVVAKPANATAATEQYSVDTAYDLQDNAGTFYDIVNITP